MIKRAALIEIILKRPASVDTIIKRPASIETMFKKAASTHYGRFSPSRLLLNTRVFSFSKIIKERKERKV